jgi:hypothetical protein
LFGGLQSLGFGSSPFLPAEMQNPRFAWVFSFEESLLLNLSLKSSARQLFEVFLKKKWGTDLCIIG